ncbi:MAG: prolyl oligopeptidase family serine peptidase [Bacteroidales bacterium]
MKKTFFYAMLVMLIATQACKNKEGEKAENLIEKPEVTVKDGIMTPEILWSFGRIGDVSVSPDQSMVTFTVKYYSIKENKGNAEIYSMKIDGSDVKQLTKTAAGENNVVWRPDGKKIGYLSSESGSMQIWEMNPDGSSKKQLSKEEGDLEGFKYAPDGKNILFVKQVKTDSTTKDIYPDLDKASGRVITDLMYKHWDTWIESYPHLFVAKYTEGSITNALDVMNGEPFETPNRPFGGMEQINWSNDGKTIAYTCRKLKGVAYTISTNSDIYLYKLDSKTTVNISEGMKGYDMSPVFSPDNSKIAWESMERDGYEADKNRLMIYDVITKEIKDYTKGFDQNVAGLAWSADGSKIYFTSDLNAKDEIFELTIADGKFRKITEGIHDITAVIPAGKVLVATRMSMSHPVDIVTVTPLDGKITKISTVNDELLAQLKMGEIKERWIKTTSNENMQEWIIYPPNFDSTKTYPTLLYCEGGPQSTVSQFWSFRWNFQMMAANGYIIVAPNRHGLPGFGQKWNEQISGDYGGQNMKDYLSAIDEACKLPYVNKDKLGCVGASYGGFSVYWLAGNHNKRFKAFIAHDGMFNLEAQYLETEEMWFVNWDLGGPYWDKNNKIAQKSYANSPHRFVDKWDTPILCIHGELDYRILASQGMQAFNAAKLRGIPAELLIFPDENHWVLKPQNGILWQRSFYKWLDKWLK